MYVHVRICTYMCVYKRIYMYMSVYVRICTYIYWYIYRYKCIFFVGTFAYNEVIMDKMAVTDQFPVHVGNAVLQYSKLHFIRYDIYIYTFPYSYIFLDLYISFGDT